MFSNIKKYKFRSNDLFEYYYKINQNTQPISAGNEKLFFIGKNNFSENNETSRIYLTFENKAINGIIQDQSQYNNDLSLNTDANIFENFIVSDINVHRYKLSYYPKSNIVVKLNGSNISNYSIDGKYLVYADKLNLQDILNINYTYTKAYQDDFYFINFLSDGYALINQSTTLEATTEFTIAVTIKLMPDYTDESLNQIIYAKGDVGQYQYYLRIQNNKFVFRTTIDQEEHVLTSDYEINKYSEQVISVIVGYIKKEDESAELRMHIYDSFPESSKQILTQKDGLNKSITFPIGDNFITPNGRNLYLGQDFTNNPDTNTFEGGIISFELRNELVSTQTIEKQFEITDCFAQNKFAFKPLGNEWSIKNIIFDETKLIEYRFSQDGINWFYINSNRNLVSSTNQHTKATDIPEIPLDLLSSFSQLYFELKMQKFISYIKSMNILVTNIQYAYNFPVVSEKCNFYRKKTRLTFTETIEFRRGYVYIKILANDVGVPINIQNVNATIVKNFTESYAFSDFEISGSSAELTKEISYKYNDFFFAEIIVRAGDQYFSKRKLVGNSDTLNSLIFQTNGKITINTSGEHIEYDIGQSNLNIKDDLVYNYENDELKEIEITRLTEEI